MGLFIAVKFFRRVTIWIILLIESVFEARLVNSVKQIWLAAKGGSALFFLSKNFKRKSLRSSKTLVILKLVG